MLVSDLQNLGMTEEEAKVYLTVLELNGSYVSAIAKRAKVNRVGCYYTLDNLVKKGLLTSFAKNKIKYYSAESPRVLVNLMEEKFERAQKLLPELMSLTSSLAYKPKIQYFEGLQGIKTIFEETLNAKEEIVGYTNLDELPKVVPPDYIRDYAKRKIEKGIRTRMLSPLTPQALEYLKRYYPPEGGRDLTEVLFINSNEYPFEYEMNIYDHFVSVISLSKEELIGMIFESPLYAKTQRSIFNLAWLGATSFVAR